MTPLIEAFVEYVRRYSIAERHSRHMAATGNRSQIDEAIAKKQEIEQEIEQHMALMVMPAWLRGRRR